MADASVWLDRLADERSRKVVFLSHCLLNENTRYPGGACRAGCVEEVVRVCLERRVGIVQMPCPEEFAWGGVLKRRLLAFFGGQGTFGFWLGKLLLPALLWYTRRVTRKLARQVAGQIADYLASGFAVVGVVGVDGSPSCGVDRTLDVGRSLDRVGRLRETARAADLNDIVRACVVAGRGMFIDLLRKELARRRLDVPFLAHDLIAELRGASLPLRL